MSIEVIWDETLRACALYLKRESSDGDHKITRPAVDIPIITDESVGQVGEITDWTQIGQVFEFDMSDSRCRIATACDTCSDESCCRRLGQCLRYKCEFGKVDKP